MRDGVTPWLDDLGEDEDDAAPARPRRRTFAIVALAALPWLVVIAVLALPGRFGADRTRPASAVEHAMTQSDAAATGLVTGADAHDGSDTAGEPSATEPSDGASAGEVFRTTEDRGEPLGGSQDSAPSGAALDESTEVPLELLELRGNFRRVPGPEEAAALAVVIARAWLTGVDPPLVIDGIEPELPDGYAEHLVVEAVERPAPEAAVVTLLAIVLDGQPKLGTQVRRLAVPIAWERTGPRPAGEPWWLPGPRLDPLVPELEPLDDPADQLLAVEALTDAGFEDVELNGLWRSSGWPVVADVDARTPEGTLVSGSVWLRDHQGKLVTAGTPLPAAELPVADVENGRTGPPLPPSEPSDSGRAEVEP